MNWLMLLMTKFTCWTVAPTIRVASTKKLVWHYNRCIVLHDRSYDYWHCQMRITLLQIAIARELYSRGVETEIATIKKAEWETPRERTERGRALLASLREMKRRRSTRSVGVEVDTEMPST